MKKVFFKKSILIILVVVMLAMTACGKSNDKSTDPEKAQDNESAKGEEETITLKFAHVLAPSHPYNLGAEKFKEILEETAPTPVNVEIFHSAQLGNERDVTEGMQLGTVDMGLVPGTIALFEPRMGVFDLPYIFRDEKHAYEVLDGEIGQELAATLPESGLHLLAYWENGFRHVTNSKHPINTPEDLVGVKMRLPENEIYQRTFEVFGANVVAMPSSETYTALQQKTVDGQENPLVHILTSKFYETQDYLSLTGHFYGPAHLVMSEEKFQSFTPEMQEAIIAAAEEARDYERQIINENREKYIEDLKATGIEINEVDKEAFTTVAKKVSQEYGDKYGDLIYRIQAE